MATEQLKIKISSSGGVGVSKDADKASKGLKQTEQQSKRTDKALSGMSRGMKVAAGAMVLFGSAVVGLKKSATTLETAAKSTKSLTRLTDLDTAAASRWVETAKVRNVQSKALNMGFISLQKSISAATNGGEQQARMFRQLGITQKELRNLDTQSLMYEIADGMQAMGATAQRTTYGQKLFGRQMQTMMPVLAGGSQGLRDILALSDRYGTTLTDSMVQKGLDAAAAQRELNMAMDGFKIMVATQILPSFVGISRGVLDFIGQMREGKGAGGEFIDSVKPIADSVSWLADRWSSLGTNMKIGTGVMAGAAVALAVTGPVGAAIVGLVGAVALVKRNWETIGPIFNRVKDNVVTAFGGIQSAVGWVVGVFQSASRSFNLSGRDWGIVGQAITNVFKIFSLTVKAALVPLSPLLRTVSGLLRATLGPAVQFAGAVFSNVFKMMLGVARGFAQTLGGVVKLISGILTLNFGQAWRGVKQIFQGGVTQATAVIKGATGIMKGAASALFDVFKNAATGAFDWVVGKAEGFVNRVIDVINFLPFGKDIQKLGGGKVKLRSRSREERGYAQGGFLEGAGRRDTVPLWAAPGEAVVTRHQQAPINYALQNTYGMNLPQLLSREKRPHYMAMGGLIPGAPSLPTPGSLGGTGWAGEYMKSLTGGIVKAAGKYIENLLSSSGGPGGGGAGSSTGLVPRVKNAISFARSNGWGGAISSGFRSRAKQQQLYNLYLQGKGNLAAPPGNSMHERGLAIDVTQYDTFAAAMARMDANKRLYRKVAGEPWHFSTTGYASGGFVRGKVSYFGPPGEKAGSTAYGYSSADPGIAVNVAGTPSGWNAPESLAWAKKLAYVKIGSKAAFLRVIDKGPSAAGRKIDVTGAGARKMGINPSNFPTDSIGTASWGKQTKNKPKPKKKKRKRKERGPSWFEVQMADAELLLTQAESTEDEADDKLARQSMRDIIAHRLRQVDAALKKKLSRSHRLTLTREKNDLLSQLNSLAEEVAPPTPPDDAGLADALRVQLKNTQDQNAVLRAQYPLFVGSFKNGGRVPADGLAYVHKDEEVIPAGAGGVRINITINGDQALADALRSAIDVTVDETVQRVGGAVSRAQGIPSSPGQVASFGRS